MNGNCLANEPVEADNEDDARDPADVRMAGLGQALQKSKGQPDELAPLKHRRSCHSLIVYGVARYGALADKDYKNSQICGIADT
jgi:hypothetical protein